METGLDPKILEKLRKLLALQEKAGTTEEAANAAAKIRDMLLKYNLDMEAVKRSDPTKVEEVRQASYNPEDLTMRHEGKWVTKLTGVIARHNMCQLILTRGDWVYIIGTKSNVQITWFLVEQLVNRLRPMSREYFARYEGAEKRNTFFRGFFLGAVDGISSTLSKEAAREVYNAKQAHTSKLEQRPLDETQTQAIALTTMLVKEQKRVEDYISSNFRLGKGKTIGKSKSQSGREIGYEAGAGMSINKGIS